MASSTISSELIISLKEDATKQAPRIAAALKRVQKQASALEKALTGSGTSDRLQKSLAKLGAEEAHVEGVAKAWRDYAQAEGLAGHAGDWTKAQAAAARTWEDAAVKAVRDVRKEEAGLARARHEQTARAEGEAIKAAHHQAAEEKRLAEETARDVVRAAERAAAEQRQLRRESERDARRAADSTARERRRIGREEAREERDRLKALSREEREAARERERLAHGNAHKSDTVAGVASLYAAHSAVHAAERVLDRYGEYDSERRYGKVVMGLTDEQQRPLVDQAIHGSANSRYNDVQWLAAQRNLAARGYNREQVLGFTPVTAQIGQAFDLEKQEDAVKLLEGAMLGFKKDVSTKDAARASAQRTADLEVKSSKISGMGAEDIEALYKRGAAAARMAGLTEEQMLAFGGAAKKVNIGGDESATAFVSLSKMLLKPTQGAMTAMRASGIDYSKYQKMGPINEEGFANDVAATYGVKLKSGVRAGLHRIFADPELMKDPAKFSPAIMRMLRRDLHGNDAKSMKSIAGLAGRYRNDSVVGVDTQGLLTAIMQGLSKNPALAIALFGSKQAGRISSGLDNDVFAHLLDELKNHSEGYGQKVSDDRMAGFKGAVLKLNNQVTILETSIGRAFDNDGNAGGGFLTHATEGVGKFVEILGEANPGLLRAGSEAVALAAGLAALKAVDYFRGGFGFKASAGALTGSAALLDGSAAALDRAAIALGASSVAKGVPGVAKSAAGAVEGAAAGAAAGAATKAAGVAEGAAAKVGVAAAAAAAGGAALATGGRTAATRAALAVGGRAAMRAIPGVGEILIANDVVKAAVDITANAIGLKKNAEELVEYEKKAGDPVLHPVMAAEHLWAHIRGKNTKEEIDIRDRVRAAAAAPTAPPKVPSAAPAEAADAADDEAEDAPPIAGARARGGPVSAGKTYLVGEHGPELFSPGLSGAISTHDVQRLLARGSYAPRADAGDGETAKAVRSMSFTLAGSVDGVARAVDRLDAKRLSGLPGQDGFDGFGGGGGGGSVPHGGGGGGRHGFMGHMPDGRYGGRRGVDGKPDGAPVTKDRTAFAGDYKENPAIRDYITASAKSRGIDPAVALKVWEHEGHAGYIGDEKSSFGPFQLHYGGISKSMPQAGMGDDFTKATGLDARDHSTIRQQVDFALNHVRRHGWGAWMGAKAEGIRGFQGVGPMPGADPGLSKDRTPLDHPAGAPDEAAPSPVKGVDAGQKIAGGSNLMSGGHYQGARPGADLTTIKTEDGRRLTVHKDAAPSFKRFLDQLQERGYKVNSLGGYAARGNRSDPSRLSEHAFGNAIDINPSTNPFRSDKTDMPADVSRMAAENGLSWGGDWRHKDNMHFEWRGVRPWEKAQAKAKEAAAKPVGETPTKEDLTRSNDEAYRSRQNPFRALAAKPDPTPVAAAQDDPLGLRRTREAAAKPAGDLHTGFSGLHGKTVKPDVDLSAIHHAQAAVDHLHESLGRVHTASAKAGRRSHEASKVAGLSSKLRGGFMHSGSQIG